MVEQKTDVMQGARDALAAMKKDRRRQSPTEIAQKMYRMNFEGNIVPHSWHIHIKRENGKPYPVAITLLSEIVYWYRPEEVKDEKTGQVIGLRKRYAADKLQRTYESFADEFGFTKRQVKSALKYLESMGVIDLDLRDIPVGDNVAGNVLFIGLDPDRLAEITYRIPSDEKVIDPLPSDEKTSEVYQIGVNGLPENRQTNTEITQETTQKTTEENPPFPEKQEATDERHAVDISSGGYLSGDGRASDSDVGAVELTDPVPDNGGGGDSLGDGVDSPRVRGRRKDYLEHLAEYADPEPDYAAPASAGGSDAAAGAALVAMYQAIGSEPSAVGTNSRKVEIEKVGQVLRDYRIADLVIAGEAGKAFGQANRESPHFVNPRLASFPSSFGIFVGKAKKAAADATARRDGIVAANEEAERALAARLEPKEVETVKGDPAWEAAKRELALQMTRQTFKQWIAGTRGVGRKDGVYTVAVPDEGGRDWLRSRLKATAERTLVGILGEAVEVQFEVAT